MENLLSNNSLVLLFWIIISFIADSNRSTNVVVIMTYIMIYIANLFNVVQTIPSLIICILALFIYFEIFCDDLKRKIINMLYKFIDFFYILFFEYSFLKFILSIFFTTSFLLDYLSIYFNITIVKFLSLIFMFWTCIDISSEKYLLYTFTEIKSRFDQICKYKDFVNKRKYIKIYNSVIFIEDKNYFVRKNKYTLFNSFYLKKIFKRNFNNYFKILIRILKTDHKIKKIKNSMAHLRGYSTIEMQLIRTLGIKEGYRYTFRRKIFEIIYSKLFFDSLYEFHKKNKQEMKYFKDYLLFIYMNTAKIMVDNKDKDLKKIRNKILNSEEYCEEELFILTLSFSGKLKWENIFEIYENIIKVSKLDVKKLIQLRNKILLDN